MLYLRRKVDAFMAEWIKRAFLTFSTKYRHSFQRITRSSKFQKLRLELVSWITAVVLNGSAMLVS